MPGARLTVRSAILGLFVLELAWLLTGLVLAPFAEGGGTSPLATLGILGSFIVLLLVTFWTVRRLQFRLAVTLFGPLPRAVADGLSCARLLLIFYVIVTFLPPWNFEGITLGMPPVAWALLLPFTVSVILIQVTAEEVVYRGFLLQTLGARFASPWIWMGIPSALFGVTHYSADASPDVAIAYVIWATAFGIACSDLTARTGALGAAIGFHFATNLLSVAFFSTPGPLGGLALFTLPPEFARESATWVNIAFDLLFLWMGWMVCRIAIRR